MRKLILGCGPRYPKRETETLCDIHAFPNVDTRWDLNDTPWPWPDNAFIGVSAEHLVEHLRSLVSFMDEAWRVLSPGGSLYIITPLAGTDPDLEWADPTHIRCYRLHTFVNYFSPEGVERFQYTTRAWNFFYLNAADGILTAHAYPIKK